MNVAGESRARGSEVDVEGDVASYLLEQGRVELVRGEHPDTPERAVTLESMSKRTRVRPHRETRTS